MDAIILNAFLYIVTFYIVYKKQKRSIFCFLYFFYTSYAIIGAFVVCTGIYYEEFSNVEGNKVPFIPYLYEYYSLLIISFPFYRLSIDKINIRSITFPKSVISILRIVFLISFIYLLFKIYEMLLYTGMDYGERRALITDAGVSLMEKESNPVLMKIAGLTYLIHDVFEPLIMLYLIYAIIWKKMSLCNALIWFGVIFIPNFLKYFIESNRSGFFFLFLNTSFYAILFFRFFDRKTKKKIISFALVILSIIAIITIGISIARFDDSQLGTTGSIIRYFGEVFPNLGYLFWDKVEHFTYGARQFTNIFEYVTGQEVFESIGLTERFEFWSSYTGIPAHYFKTLFGDLYVEFGTYGALVFVTVLGAFAKMILRKGLTVTNFTFAFYYYCFCLNSILNYPMYYSSNHFIKVLILLLLSNIFLNKYQFIKTKKI